MSAKLTEEKARRACAVLHRYGTGAGLDRPVTARELATGNWRAMCCMPENILEDARNAVEFLIEQHGPGVMILDEVQAPRPAWAWLETIEQMERDAKPYREHFEQWLHDEAARQQREALRTSCAAKYQQAESAAAARKAAEFRKRRALQQKEQAEAALAQAEADAFAAAEQEAAAVSGAAPEIAKRTGKKIVQSGVVETARG